MSSVLEITLPPYTPVPGMDAVRAESARLTHRAEWLGVGLLVGVIVIVLQFWGGAYSNELGGFPDEAAHYVTGLMVHDYLFGGDWNDPLGFAETFYTHYPKVGLGHWPPMFYVVAAVWMKVFSTSPFSLMAMIAFATWLMAITVGFLLRERVGWCIAMSAMVMLIATPIVQQYANMVMMEIPVALLCLWAVIIYGRYLDSPTWQRGLSFGLIASVAILTKGSGMVLALVPPFALLLTWRWALLKRLSFYLPAFIVAATCVPWYAATLDYATDGHTAETICWAYTHKATGYYAEQLPLMIGPVLGIAACIGLLPGRWVRGRTDKRSTTGSSSFRAVMAAGLPASILFHVIVPSSLDPRHLITALPFAAVFAGVGLQRVADGLRLIPLGVEARRAVVAIAVFGLFGALTFEIPDKTCRGFAPIAEQLINDPNQAHAVVLVSSNSAGEGMFIAEVAARETRPGHVVARSSKVLSESDWDGGNLEMRFNSPEAIMSRLESMPVDLVVLDRTTPDMPQYTHHLHLIEAIESYSEHWSLERTFPITVRNRLYPEGIEVYRLVPRTNHAEIISRLVP